MTATRLLAYQSLYEDPSPARNAELERCRELVHANPLVTQRVYLRESTLPPRVIDTPAMRVVLRRTRPTFRDFLDLFEGGDTINVLANSDVYFDETLALVARLGRRDCFALSRWDVQPDGSSRLFDEPASQDVWCFRGRVPDALEASFFLGWPGCDNRFAHEVARAGYALTNPARSLRCHHLHLSGVRSESWTNPAHVVPGPHRAVPLSSL